MAELKKYEDEAPKVSIISVVGAFRTGKSFLLSTLLRYLKQCDEGKEPGENWMSQPGDVFSEGNQEIADAESGFGWRSGSDRMTTGIWMYNKPFIRKLPSGEKVCLLLMDTQGMFDFKTTKELTAAIFGLSTLISSYQIYNIAKQIQEDKLQQLHYFTEFSRVALKEFELAQQRREQNNPKFKADVKPGPPFQTLDFLVRDWQNFADDEDIAKCLEEMPAVLKAAMETDVQDDGTRESIKSAFHQVKCFLLPHPGTKMTKKQFSGTLSDIENNFIKLLEIYVKRVCDEGVVAKQIQGRCINASALDMYIRAYAAVFKEGKLPKAYTLVQAISTTTNLCAKDDALKMYKSYLNNVMNANSYMDPEKLEAAHTECRDGALDKYDQAACFGEEEFIKATRAELIARLDEAYSEAMEKNKLKMHASLEKYILPLLVAVGAFFLDWISDYVCDAWSDTCRKLSRNFALLYYCVAIVLIYEFTKIYRTTGSGASVVMGATALFQGATVKFKEIQDLIQKKLQQISEDPKNNPHAAKSKTQ